MTLARTPLHLIICLSLFVATNCSAAVITFVGENSTNAASLEDFIRRQSHKSERWLALTSRPSRSWRRLHNKLSAVRDTVPGFHRQDRFIRLSDILPLVHLPFRAPYVREEAGTHRYNVGTDTPKL